MFHLLLLLLLLKDYKAPLMASNLIPSAKVESIFYRIQDIFACHYSFRIALEPCIANWDEDGRIGEQFIENVSHHILPFKDVIRRKDNEMKISNDTQISCDI